MGKWGRRRGSQGRTIQRARRNNTTTTATATRSSSSDRSSKRSYNNNKDGGTRERSSLRGRERRSRGLHRVGEQALQARRDSRQGAGLALQTDGREHRAEAARVEVVQLQHAEASEGEHRADRGPQRLDASGAAALRRL